MASKTTNYNLHKIDLADSPPDITVLNPNFDTIDTQLKALSDTKVSNTDLTTVNNVLTQRLDEIKKWCQVDTWYAQSIASDIHTNLDFDGITGDTSFLRLANNRILLKKGLYEIKLYVAMNNVSSGYVSALLDNKEGKFNAANGGHTQVTVSTIMGVATDDQQLTVSIYQSSGAAKSTIPGNLTSIRIRKVAG